MEIICGICAIFGTGILVGIILLVWMLKLFTQEEPVGCVTLLGGLALLACFILTWLLCIAGS